MTPYTSFLSKHYLPSIWGRAALLHLALFALGLAMVPYGTIAIAAGAALAVYGFYGYACYMYAANTMPYPSEEPSLVRFWAEVGRRIEYATLPCQIEEINDIDLLTRWPYRGSLKEVYAFDGSYQLLGHFQWGWDDEKDMTFFPRHVHVDGKVKRLPIIARWRSPQPAK